jgi:methyl-accepting chemotaxis protein
MENFSIRAKLVSAFLCISTFSLALGVISIIALNQTQSLFEHISDHNLPQTEELGSLRGTSREALALLLQTGLPDTTPAEQARVKGKLEAALQRYAEIETTFLKSDLTQDEKKQ